ncbi:flagellar hook-associated protein FlgL [Geoalkalibacter sp.]|uniref:flagellar hook-associated protein FlgL n=1 Tax=Geoalkalibacter sp. TaxID=3041440 RepID=UPI00272DE1EB|nr:flagellar hook-associated protein FlgL [Geoalkalibacter sp.]
MRATLTTTYRSLLANLTQSSTRLEDLRLQAATGKRMSKPSDDPSAIRPVLNARGQIRMSERFLNTLGTAADRLNILDTHMERVENLMQRSKETLVYAGNGSLSPQDLATLGDQVRLMKDELLSVANANVDGKYLFSGYKENVKPYPTGTPGEFDGDPSAIDLEVGPGEKVKVNLTGPEVFGDPGTGKDMWQLFDDMIAALAAGNADAALAEMSNLDRAADQARTQRSQAGNLAQRVDQAQTNMQDMRIDMMAMLSRFEDADIVETLTHMTMQETAFKAALDITSRVSRLSILDYMR